MAEKKNYVLGLDLGTNSLGWVAIEIDAKENPLGLLTDMTREGALPSMGVRIFEAGVDGVGRGEKEVSRNVKRRMARLQRRQTVRRRQRRRVVFGLLVTNGFFSPKTAATKSQQQDAFIKELDAVLLGRMIDSADYESAVHHLPYVLRAKALDQALRLDELGRVFYHLSQRRGFLSNRKDQSGKSKNEELGAVKSGIQELDKLMLEAGARTYGEYFAKLPFDGSTRIRKRWTSRKRYIEEFDLIWKSQAAYHPEILTDLLYKRFRNALFFQRPLKSPKDLIGRCELEGGAKYSKNGVVYRTAIRARAPEYCLEAQRFRILCDVANVRIIDSETPIGGRPLSNEQRELLVKKLCIAGDKFAWKDARALLGLERTAKFNLQENGDTGFKTNRTNAAFYDIFGNDWERASIDVREAVVSEVAGLPDDPDVALRVLKRKTESGKSALVQLGVTQEALEAVCDIGFSTERMSYSRRAIRRLTPHLEAGKNLYDAIRAEYGDKVNEVAVGQLEPVRKVLGALRNPIVERSLSELRRVVNEIIKLHGKPTLIRLELARDLKRSKKERGKIQAEQRSREKQREKAARSWVGDSPHARASSLDIERILLAEEMNWVCPYSGRAISMEHLQSGAVDVDHIIPYSRCLDDSFTNKTVCFADFNRHKKGDRTPFEMFGGEGKEWAEFEERVRKATADSRGSKQGISPGKAKRFLLRDEALREAIDGFTASQLNDTRHASVRAREYLMSLFGGNLASGIDAEGRVRVQVGSGQVTAQLRRYYQLPAVLNLREKTRDDHRHHAIDAVAIALTDAGAVKRLSDASRRSLAMGSRRLIDGNLPEPWPEYGIDLRAAAESMVVSFRVDNRTTGPLHAESIYSPTKTAPDGTSCTHIRKPVDKLSFRDLEDIVDHAVRNAIESKLKELGTDDPSKLLTDASTTPYLLARSGNLIPIRRVRVRKVNTVRRFGAGIRARHMESGSNHHVAVYRKLGQTKEQLREEVVPLYEARRRAATGEVVVLRTTADERAVAVFSSGTMLRCEGKAGLSYYRIRGLTAGEIELSLHRDASSKYRPLGLRITPSKLCRMGEIVVVTPAGSIQRSHARPNS